VEQEVKLPALREVGALAEQEQLPGSGIMDFLVYLNSEILKAIEIVREETQEALQEGDASERIASVNKVRMHRRKLQGHFQKEITEIRGILKGLREDKHVLETLNVKIREISRDVGLALEDMVSEFDV